MKKAIVLLSGGMDSAVTLYIAKKDYECHALIFDYGQKAAKEITCARKIAGKAGCGYRVLEISLPWQGSALLDGTKAVPRGSISSGGVIPETYVPARNIIFLGFGISFAEAAGAEAVFIGAHQLDFSNYPDCRDEFFTSFRETARYGTRSGSEGHEIAIVTPIIDKTKKEIVDIGSRLGVPFEDTWSCYQGGREPCGSCESCLFRIQAFKDAGMKDPTQ
ncbi:MAG: 7-cyano-7-deazaguanine synthase QueC [Candidatus Makaraimicrobium thalassicum]|nr:MAG: 7-cyano-7-deazaguanine synthase QueC [Candidatus Omnitrophota bacterium]